MARHRMPAFLHDICGARGLFLDFECCFHVQIMTRILTAFYTVKRTATLNLFYSTLSSQKRFDRIFTMVWRGAS